MTYRQLYLCAALLTFSLVGSFILMAVALGVVGFEGPPPVPVYYSHVHSLHIVEAGK
jgi:hypothetical protein